jgi:GH15 family glucan-1,4-alpha-glucosidase
MGIKDYFLIGDLHTAALVSKNASIDWLCVPHFDSPSVFASLLDKKAGTFGVEAGGFSSEAHYKENTAVVETIFRNDDKVFSVIDFMLPQPIEECGSHFLVRKITGVKGNSAIKLLFDPRPDYARKQAEIKMDNNSLRVEIGSHTLWLHAPKNTILDDLEIKEGETKQFILEYSLDSTSRNDNRDFEKETEAFWKEWIKTSAAKS